MKKQCTLSIDTSKTDETYVRLTRGEEQFEKRVKRHHTSQETLRMIEDLLLDHRMSLSDIKSVSVCRGPGSFTGIRVGIAVGMMLSALLTVPINGQPPGSYIEPEYGNDPWV